MPASNSSASIHQTNRDRPLVVASLNPAPIADLVRELARFPVVLSVEAHYVTGGVGSLVAEVIAEHGLSCRLVRCAVRETATGVTGSQDYLHHANGLSRDALVEAAMRIHLAVTR